MRSVAYPALPCIGKAPLTPDVFQDDSRGGARFPSINPLDSVAHGQTLRPIVENLDPCECHLRPSLELDDVKGSHASFHVLVVGEEGSEGLAVTVVEGLEAALLEVLEDGLDLGKTVDGC